MIKYDKMTCCLDKSKHHGVYVVNNIFSVKPWFNVYSNNFLLNISERED